MCSECKAGVSLVGFGVFLVGFGVPHPILEVPDPVFGVSLVLDPLTPSVTPPQRRTHPWRSGTGTRSGGRRSTRGPRGRSWSRAGLPRWALGGSGGWDPAKRDTPMLGGGWEVPESLGMRIWGTPGDWRVLWGRFGEPLTLSGCLGSLPAWVLGCPLVCFGVPRVDFWSL